MNNNSSLRVSNSSNLIQLNTDIDILTFIYNSLSENDYLEVKIDTITVASSLSVGIVVGMGLGYLYMIAGGAHYSHLLGYTEIPKILST